MLHAFGHHIAICCDRLQHVGCFCLKFENGQIFHATLVDVVRCYSRLARFVQQCCPRACALVRFSIPNNSQLLNTSQQGGQTHATCCSQKYCDMLRWNVAIVWPGLNTTQGNFGFVLIFSGIWPISPVRCIPWFLCQFTIHTEPKDAFIS